LHRTLLAYPNPGKKEQNDKVLAARLYLQHRCRKILGKEDEQELSESMILGGEANFREIIQDIDVGQNLK